MDNLTNDIQRTIRALEVLSERSSSASEPLDALLDQLFQQKIDLAGVAHNTGAAAYQETARSMAAAATAAERATEDPGYVRTMFPAVEEAIGRLAKLLDSLAPAP